mgnify:CR=1 FL=1
MGEQFNKYGERVRRKIYTGGWVTGGYPVEAGAKQLGIFDSRRPRTVNVKGYSVKPYPRRWPRESGGVYWLDALVEEANEEASIDESLDYLSPQQLAALSPKKGPSYWEKALATVEAQKKKLLEAQAANVIDDAYGVAEAADEETLQVELAKLGIDAKTALNDIDKLTPAQLKQMHGTASKKAAKKKVLAQKIATARKKTVLAGVSPRASYTWIPWTVGIIALAYWFTRP